MRARYHSFDFLRQPDCLLSTPLQYNDLQSWYIPMQSSSVYLSEQCSTNNQSLPCDQEASYRQTLVSILPQPPPPPSYDSAPERYEASFSQEQVYSHSVGYEDVETFRSKPSTFTGATPSDSHPILLSGDTAPHNAASIVHYASLEAPNVETCHPEHMHADRYAYDPDIHISNPECFKTDYGPKDGDIPSDTPSNDPVSEPLTLFYPMTPNPFSNYNQLSPHSPLSSEPPSPSTSDSSLSTPSPSPLPTLGRLKCPACNSTFAKHSSLNRHQESVHGRKEARKLLLRDIKWWEARALMDMALRKHSKDKAFKRVLKDAVGAFKRGERERFGGEGFVCAFEEFARMWLEESTCCLCGVEFSRRDAADRRHRCVVAL
jgi:hypothetical protein